MFRLVRSSQEALYTLAALAHRWYAEYPRMVMVWAWKRVLYIHILSYIHIYIYVLCIISYHIILYYIILYYIILYYVMLCYIILCYIILYYIMLYIILYFILYYIILCIFCIYNYIYIHRVIMCWFWPIRSAYDTNIGSNIFQTLVHAIGILGIPLTLASM